MGISPPPGGDHIAITIKIVLNPCLLRELSYICITIALVVIN